MGTRTPRLITVSREFGAGGSELAAELGQRLRWPVLDQNIVQRVAEHLRLDEGTVLKFDEHTPSLLARIATVLIVPQPESYSFPPASDLPGHDAIAHATRAVIEQFGATPPAIIVGHGAQCIFAGRDDVLHVRVVADVRHRLARVVRRLGVDRSAAAAMLRRADHDRQAYVQRYFHREWRDELLYHMQFNTAVISIEDAADLVAEFVRRGGGVPPTAEAPAR